MSEPYWMDLKAVAVKLCVSRETVRRMALRGELKRDVLPGFKCRHKYVTSSVNEAFEKAKHGGGK